MRRESVCIFFFALFVMFGASRFARAADDAVPSETGATESEARNQEIARAAVKRGFQAAARGDYAAALAEYQRAEALVPEANLPHRYAAEALVALERWDDAIAEYEKYLLNKPDVKDAASIRERIAVLRSRSQALLSVTTEPEGAQIFVDGVLIGATPLSVSVLPGPRAIRALRTGFAAHETVVHAGRGERVALKWSLVPDLAHRPDEREREQKKATSPLRTIGWIGVALGGALATTSIIGDSVFLGRALDRVDEERQRAGGDPDGARAEANRIRTFVIAGYIAGGALLATGIGLVLFAPKRTSKGAALHMTTQGAQFDLRF